MRAVFHWYTVFLIVLAFDLVAVVGYMQHGNSLGVTFWCITAIVLYLCIINFFKLHKYISIADDLYQKWGKGNKGGK